MQAGYDGLLCDKTRPSRIPPLGLNITERVVTFTQTDPSTEATHWTASIAGKAVDTARVPPNVFGVAAAPGETVQALKRPTIRR